MIPKSLNVACFSDFHSGHPKNPMERLAANLKAAFPDNQETADLDILFIAGDFFDGLMISDSDAYFEASDLIVYLLRLCKKHDIVLRVLRGTPSHDYNQNRLFEHLNAAGKIGCDLKYWPILGVEIIERFGISVLYIPDEWESHPDKTLDQAQDAIAAKGLEQVDFAIMHGNFPHQLPPIVKSHKHDPQQYLQLVKHLIFIGHVHFHSIYADRIIAQGSFDRLAHGEEGPKGHIRAIVHDNGYHEVQFVENKHALIFKTIECRGLTIGETLEEIQNNLGGIPDGSHIRISCSKSNPILQDMDQLIRLWPLITWSKLVKDLKIEDEGFEEVLEESDYVPITITPENIEKLVMDRLFSQDLSGPILELARKSLQEMK